MSHIKTYTELSKLETFEERFKYLKLSGKVGEDTFGFDRYMNQRFYRSKEWTQLRHKIIARDNGCDLGVKDRAIFSKIIIHHMNPVTVEDLENNSELVFDPEYLISVSHNTHNAIHYGDESLLITDPIERTPNDTCPWKT